MRYDIEHFWIALVLALALGAFCVLPTRSAASSGPRIVRRGTLGMAIFVAVGLVLAIAEVVPGRAGLWLEIAVLLVVAYLLGWLIGWRIWTRSSTVAFAHDVPEGEQRPRPSVRSKRVGVSIAMVASAFALLAATIFALIGRRKHDG